VSIRRLQLKIRTSLHSSNALQNFQVWFRSICNYGNLLGLHCTFSTVSGLPSKGFSWKFVPRTLHTCTRSSASLFATDQQVRALYMRSSVSLRLYLCFHWQYFPENLHLIFQWPPFTVRTYLEAFCLLVTGEAGVWMFLMDQITFPSCTLHYISTFGIPFTIVVSKDLLEFKFSINFFK
jgi:hypothetical protein